MPSNPNSDICRGRSVPFLCLFPRLRYANAFQAAYQLYVQVCHPATTTWRFASTVAPLNDCPTYPNVIYVDDVILHAKMSNELRLMMELLNETLATLAHPSHSAWTTRHGLCCNPTRARSLPTSLQHCPPRQNCGSRPLPSVCCCSAACGFSCFWSPPLVLAGVALTPLQTTVHPAPALVCYGPGPSRSKEQQPVSAVEAGATVSTNVLLRDLNLVVERQDDRRVALHWDRGLAKKTAEKNTELQLNPKC